MEQATSTFGTIFLSTSTLWALLAVVAVVFIIISSILHYHWTSYSNKSKSMGRAMKTYYIVSLIILVIAAIFVITI